MTRLTDVETHFAFGRNWRSYARLIDRERIAEAEHALRRLIGDLHGKSFVDVGCGSGLHALAAARLGASEIVAIDVDPDSAATATEVLAAVQASHEVHQLSIFDVPQSWKARFDVVYSWGVLHHTGDMEAAIRSAAALVRPGGLFAFALYGRTPLCGFWRHEKRVYSSAPRAVQLWARGAYATVGLVRQGRRFVLGATRTDRGMDFWHDVHDWLGGYPYESITPAEVDALMRALGFSHVRSFVSERGLGVLGSGCDEYVYERKARSI